MSRAQDRKPALLISDCFQRSTHTVHIDHCNLRSFSTCELQSFRCPPLRTLCVSCQSRVDPSSDLHMDLSMLRPLSGRRTTSFGSVPLKTRPTIMPTYSPATETRLQYSCSLSSYGRITQRLSFMATSYISRTCPEQDPDVHSFQRRFLECRGSATSENHTQAKTCDQRLALLVKRPPDHISVSQVLRRCFLLVSHIWFSLYASTGGLMTSRWEKIVQAHPARY